MVYENFITYMFFTDINYFIHNVLFVIVLIYFDSFDFKASQVTETKIYHYTRIPYINRMITFLK